MDYKLARRLAFPLIKFLWPVEVINKHNFVEGKGVYVCNHYSVMDSNNLITQLFKSKFNVVVKEEAFSSKIGKKFLTWVGGIPIKRGDADLKAIKNCMDVLRRGEPLVLFPEGTRNKEDSREMLEIKEGAAMFAIKTKSPITPMLYYSKVKLFKKTYLIIGEQINYDDLSDTPMSESREIVTERMRASFSLLREEIDRIVETKGALRIVRKNEKESKRQAKKANRLAKMASNEAKKNSRKGKI